MILFFFFFFQAEDGIRDKLVTGVQTCALPISHNERRLNREYWSETSPSLKEWRLQVNLYFPIGGSAPANAKRKRADRAHSPSFRPTRCRGPEVRSTAGDRGRRRGPPPLWPRRLRVNLRCVPRKCSFPGRRTSSRSRRLQGSGPGHQRPGCNGCYPAVFSAQPGAARKPHGGLVG